MREISPTSRIPGGSPTALRVNAPSLTFQDYNSCPVPFQIFPLPCIMLSVRACDQSKPKKSKKWLSRNETWHSISDLFCSDQKRNLPKPLWMTYCFFEFLAWSIDSILVFFIRGFLPCSSPLLYRPPRAIWKNHRNKKPKEKTKDDQTYRDWIPQTGLQSKCLHWENFFLVWNQGVMYVFNYTAA